MSRFILCVCVCVCVWHLKMNTNVHIKVNCHHMCYKVYNINIHLDNRLPANKLKFNIHTLFL